MTKLSPGTDSILSKQERRYYCLMACDAV